MSDKLLSKLLMSGLHMNIHSVTFINWRRATRFVFNDYSRCSSMTSLLSQLNWPSLQLHRDQSSLIIFFKIIHNLVNIPHSFLHSPPYSTHCPNKFIHLHSRTELFKNSFFPRTIRLWNCLSESIREVNNLENFVQLINQ